MSETVYILGDADRVRLHVESALFSNDLRALSRFSRNLTAAITSLARRLNEDLQAEIIMAGGDDLLVIASLKSFDLLKLREAGERFASDAGCSISFGVGSSVNEAYLGLRRAKSSGGGVVVDSNKL